jgi:preprotein translocase subunit SecF
MNTRWLIAPLLLTFAVTPACERSRTPSDQVAQNTDDTGRFEIVRERAGTDGRLQIRVRAQNLDAADRIAHKLAEVKKSNNQRIASVEFIGPQDAEDAPARRTVNP